MLNHHRHLINYSFPNAEQCNDQRRGKMFQLERISGFTCEITNHVCIMWCDVNLYEALNLLDHLIIMFNPIEAIRVLD